MESSKKILLTTIGIAILVVLVSGVTFAFFNYTRTGTANVIRTGQINFLTTQGTTLNLTDVFPIASNEVGNSNALTLRIEGDITYTGGEEFEITFDSVNNTINNKVIPINYIATYAPTATGENIGSEATNYFSERGLTSTVYKLTATGEIEIGKQVLVGFIPRNGEIDGTLTIRAYLDSSRIAITDTLEGIEEASAEYENGTTTTWVKERTVLTTEEWNNLRDTQTPLSFKIKAVSQEGTWVEPPALPSIPSCPGCKFMYVEFSNEYHYGNNGSTVAELEADNIELVDDYTTLNSNYFLGLKIENNVVTKAYACGIKSETPNQGTPFCLESLDKSATAYENNFSLITGSNLWDDADGSKGRCFISEYNSEYNADSVCTGNVSADIHYNTEYDNSNWVASEKVSDMLWCYVGGVTWDDEPIFYCGSLG